MSDACACSVAPLGAADCADAMSATAQDIATAEWLTLAVWAASAWMFWVLSVAADCDTDADAATMFHAWTMPSAALDRVTLWLVAEPRLDAADSAPVLAARDRVAALRLAAVVSAAALAEGDTVAAISPIDWPSVAVVPLTPTLVAEPRTSAADRALVLADADCAAAVSPLATTTAAADWLGLAELAVRPSAALRLAEDRETDDDAAAMCHAVPDDHVAVALDCETDAEGAASAAAAPRLAAVWPTDVLLAVTAQAVVTFALDAEGDAVPAVRCAASVTFAVVVETDCDAAAPRPSAALSEHAEAETDAEEAVIAHVVVSAALDWLTDAAAAPTPNAPLGT